MLDTGIGSGGEVDSTLETTLSMICSTKLGRMGTLTCQETDFLKAGIHGNVKESEIITLLIVVTSLFARCRTV